MMHIQPITPRLLRVLFVNAMAFVVSGCSMAQIETFTVQAELPENFTVNGTAYYEPAPGERCMAPSGEERRGPGRKFFKSEQPKTAHLLEFKVPLTDTAHGCSMVLQDVELAIRGQWGKRDLDMGLDSAALAITDELLEDAPSLSTSEPLVFQGQCQWFFRTVGSKRYIRKILQCRALDANGVVQKSLAGGALQRDQLAGKTVKLVLTEAKEELPAVGDNWIKFPAGWKRCMGKGLDDLYGFCRENTTDFKSFKMPDGRDCTVYPNCTE
jgi:hypothetical protein